ncbi:MAG: Rpn family recombination-promoting nuclease/putative transposase [Longicatena sp.]|nr:Rpn family recombination-promoting nuclease/putative transposase [Longicatena sp.]
MAQKDMVEKLLEDHEDVFADIVNVLLFNGERVISERSLKETKLTSQYKAETGKLHEQERDVAKYWIDGNARIALCGLENQTSEEKYMPLRVIGYDGVSYRQQLMKENKGNEIVPVVTLVLYYGTSRWSSPHNLKGVLDINDKFKPFVNDYKANIFNIAFLDEETVQKFTSDFRIVADFFVQKRKNKSYEPSRQKITHVDEVLKFLRAMTGDSRYEVEFSKEDKERGVNMCNVIDKVEKNGIEKGIFDIISRMLKKGKSVQEIVDLTDYEEAKVQEIADALENC